MVGKKSDFPTQPSLPWQATTTISKVQLNSSPLNQVGHFIFAFLILIVTSPARFFKLLHSK
jgi:hypothetical protein